MTIDPKFLPALAWYTGKSLENAKLALAQLTEAEALGYWPAGYARGVKAKLNKANVGIKLARANEKALADSVKDLVLPSDGQYFKAGWRILHAMNFGGFHSAADVAASAKALKVEAFSPKAQEFLSKAEQWGVSFLDVATVIDKLDATRPKPVYFMETLSATVLANVSDRMGVSLASVVPAPIIWVEIEKVDKNGKKYFTWVPEIQWPEGTTHNTSRFAYGTARNHQCHACGHAIKNAFNWVPLVGSTETGPVSFWVGKDCAENLFGCKVTNNDTVAMPGAPGVE